MILVNFALISHGEQNVNNNKPSAQSENSSECAVAIFTEFLENGWYLK